MLVCAPVSRIMSTRHRQYQASDRIMRPASRPHRTMIIPASIRLRPDSWGDAKNIHFLRDKISSTL